MEERRKNRRLGLTSRLLLKRLDQDGGAEELQIDVVDVSKTGVGFVCKESLEIGSVYESYLTIWTKEVLHAFMGQSLLACRRQKPGGLRLTAP